MFLEVNSNYLIKKGKKISIHTTDYIQSETEHIYGVVSGWADSGTE